PEARESGAHSLFQSIGVVASILERSRNGHWTLPAGFVGQRPEQLVPDGEKFADLFSTNTDAIQMGFGKHFGHRQNLKRLPSIFIREIVVERDDERMPSVKVDSTGLRVEPCQARFRRFVIVNDKAGDELPTIPRTLFQRRKE